MIKEEDNYKKILVEEVYKMIEDKGHIALIADRNTFKSQISRRLALKYALLGKNVVHCSPENVTVTHYQKRLIEDLEKIDRKYTINRKNISLENGGSVFFINKWYNDLPDKQIMLIEDSEAFLSNNENKDIIIDKLCNYGYERIFITCSLPDRKESSSFLYDYEVKNQKKLYSLIDTFKEGGINMGIFRIGKEDYNGIMRIAKIKELTGNR